MLYYGYFRTETNIAFFFVFVRFHFPMGQHIRHPVERAGSVLRNNVGYPVPVTVRHPF